MAEETKAVSFRLLTWAARLQRIGRSVRSMPYEDAVQTGWASTTVRRDTDGARAAMQAVSSAERGG